MRPAVLLRSGGGHARGKLATGRECFVIDDSELPPGGPVRALRALEILSRGFDCYEASESICDLGYFSPDLVYLVDGRVTPEAETRLGDRARSKSSATTRKQGSAVGKQSVSRDFPLGWQTAKQRQQALRYFELFLADNRIPLAQAYHQIRWSGPEHEKLLSFSFRMPIRVSPADDWDGTYGYELETRREAADQYLTAIRALASTSALTLTFTLDAAAELLRSDLECEREEMVPGNTVIAGRSLFELIRAGSNWARHHRTRESGPGRTKPLNWTELVLKDLELLEPRPGDLGTLEEMYLKLPFPTWLAFERRYYAEARHLVDRLIKA